MKRSAKKTRSVALKSIARRLREMALKSRIERGYGQASLAAEVDRLAAEIEGAT